MNNVNLPEKGGESVNNNTIVLPPGSAFSEVLMVSRARILYNNKLLVLNNDQQFLILTEHVDIPKS